MRKSERARNTRTIGTKCEIKSKYINRYVDRSATDTIDLCLDNINRHQKYHFFLSIFAEGNRRTYHVVRRAICARMCSYICVVEKYDCIEKYNNITYAQGAPIALTGITIVSYGKKCGESN